MHQRPKHTDGAAEPLLVPPSTTGIHTIFLVGEAGRRPDDAARVPSSARQGRVTLRGRIHWLDAEAVLDELDEDQLALSMRIAGLERACQLASKDEVAHGTVRRLSPRLADLADVCDLLHAVQKAATAPGAHRAFLPDAPLADYVRGVYAWMNAVVRALEELVFSARRRERPSGRGPRATAIASGWPAYRRRIEEAGNLHFHELERAIRLDLAQLIEDVSEDGDDHDVVDFTRPGSHALDGLLASFDALLRRASELEARLDRDGSDDPLER